MINIIDSCSCGMQAIVRRYCGLHCHTSDLIDVVTTALCANPVSLSDLVFVSLMHSTMPYAMKEIC